MMDRRSFLLAVAALLASSRLGWAQAGGDQAATAFIERFGQELESIVNASDSTEGKKERMQPLVESAVAVDEIGRFTLGPWWPRATPAQQQRFLQLFHAVLINTITSKLGEFRGVTFRMTQTTERNGDYFVGTQITRPNQQPNNVQWVVSTASGRPQIIDVLAEGTSLRLTQRADYSSYISRNGNKVEALLTALQRQAG